MSESITFAEWAENQEQNRMTRRIQFVVGIGATILNIVAIVYFLRWLRYCMPFSNAQPPPVYILTSLWTSLIGVIATATWFLIGLYGKLASRRSTAVKPAFSMLMLFQGITLAVLLLPACLALGLSAGTHFRWTF